jgi:hypothetical protein
LGEISCTFPFFIDPQSLNDPAVSHKNQRLFHNVPPWHRRNRCRNASILQSLHENLNDDGMHHVMRSETDTRQNTPSEHVSAINNYTDNNTNTLRSQFVVFTQACWPSCWALNRNAPIQ